MADPDLQIREGPGLTVWSNNKVTSFPGFSPTCPMEQERERVGPHRVGKREPWE